MRTRAGCLCPPEARLFVGLTRSAYLRNVGELEERDHLKATAVLECGGHATCRRAETTSTRGQHGTPGGRALRRDVGSYRQQVAVPVHEAVQTAVLSQDVRALASSPVAVAAVPCTGPSQPWVSGLALGRRYGLLLRCGRWPPPPLRPVQTYWSVAEVVRVSQNDLASEVAQLCCGEALHGPLGADRHEDRGVHMVVGQDHPCHARLRRPAPRHNLKLQRRHQWRRHQRRRRHRRPRSHSRRGSGHRGHLATHSGCGVCETVQDHPVFLFQLTWPAVCCGVAVARGVARGVARIGAPCRALSRIGGAPSRPWSHTVPYCRPWSRVVARGRPSSRFVARGRLASLSCIVARGGAR